MAIADVALALLAFSWGLPILLLAFSDQIKGAIQNSYPRIGIQVITDPTQPIEVPFFRPMNQLERDKQKVERPYFWLNNSIKLLWISGFPLLGQVLVDSYDLTVPSQSWNPFLLTGIAILTAGVYYIFRVSFVVLTNDPLVTFGSGPMRYALVVLVPLADIFTLSKLTAWIQTFASSGVVAQLLTGLLVLDYIASIVFLVTLTRASPRFDAKTYLPLIFWILPWVVALLLRVSLT